VAVLEKPFEMEDLLELLDRHAGRSEVTA